MLLLTDEVCSSKDMTEEKKSIKDNLRERAKVHPSDQGEISRYEALEATVKALEAEVRRMRGSPEQRGGSDEVSVPVASGLESQQPQLSAFCTKCGKPRSGETSFCTSCGTAYDKSGL